MKKAKQYHKLARTMFSILLAIISMLSYLAMRPLFDSLYGTYFVGLLDGIVIIILVLVIVFYLVSSGTHARGH